MNKDIDEYKHKGFVISKILEGEDFSDKKFDLFRKDEDVILVAIKENGYVLYEIEHEFFNSKEMIFKLINITPRRCLDDLISVCPIIAEDKEYFLKLVERYQAMLFYGSDEMKNDYDVLNVCRDYLMNDENQWIGKEKFIASRDKLIKMDRERELFARLKENEVVPEYANKIKETKQVKRKI